MYEDGAIEKVINELNSKIFINCQEYVTALRILARENYIPVMREKTSYLLGEIISKANPKQILEIGTSLGVSGITALLNSIGRLTTIDIDECVLTAAKKSFERCNILDRCEFILGDCMEVVDMMEGNSYDFIILDGPKGQYLELYKMLFPMLCENGIIFVDDTNYFELINKDGFVERKHRTIVNAMRHFLDTINNDKRVTVTAYDIENGVTVIRRI